ncbi:MAG: SAM-dependent methyltransferase [Acidobacteriota bacterium]
MSDNVQKFLDGFAESLRAQTFVKLTLGNYKGADKHLQKIQGRLIDTKKGTRLFVLYRSETRDTVKNYAFAEGRKIIGETLGKDFFSGHLFTTAGDLQLEIGKNGRSRLNEAKPTFKTPAALKHDREKHAQIDSQSFYLKALGITDDEGRVRDKQQAKWRQINKFVEILADLVDKSALRDRKELKIVDMGSGKGYLTFAAYDYFITVRGVDVEMAGVDTKPDIVALCNEIAAAGGFDGLKFVEGTIADFEVEHTDILIALHACDTATDDALYKAINANAEIVIAVPCCHKEIRRQMRSPDVLTEILKHGVMSERMAETLTDGIRSMLLEKSGYSTKLFEFVATEHTPKNNMLVGTRTLRPNGHNTIDEKLNSLKDLFGITEQRLETLLNLRVAEAQIAEARKK